MISELNAVPTLPTADLARARTFYEDTLGLRPEGGDEPGGLFYRCGQGRLFVYESSYAGTNQATAVTFETDQSKFDSEVAQLRSKGVTFLTFDYEGMVWDGDVAKTENMRAVWFTDPDGNILNLSAM
ncbi:VOC family protein [Allorhizocola rhizosphaerae]|uniref:VOC family protein n=1 Tax=Allorhizocola rhizosphaerae TaxID=1872709 RepID=UPI000E3E49C3|nr:VOC family protein [Allorhizocola rhizosphaerae]